MATITPYLFFNGRCQEALDFYTQALGAKVSFVMRFKESPLPHQPGQLPAGWEDKVMHASFTVGGALLQVSDGNGHQKKFEGFCLSLSYKEEAEVRNAFAALAEGGKVGMPLEKTFWSPCFGMVTDKFGVGWNVAVEG